MRKEAFFESSKKIVQDFLNSVVAVDDNLFFGEVYQNDTIDSDDGFDSVVEDDSGLGQIVNQVVTPMQSDNPGEHPLNYQELSLAFSEVGINCCAFRPDNERFGSIEATADQIMRSAKRADITILDWSMDNKFGALSGTLAKRSIDKILCDDQCQHGRLRLIVIYTGEPNRQEIAEDICRSVSAVDDGAICQGETVSFRKSGLEFCQLTVIEKKDDAKELRDEVVSLFTKLTTGLLSNATLSAIGEIRDKTHHILHTFNKQLDPAYLAHVIGLLSSPQVREKSYEIAFDYATDLISEEIKSNLQISSAVKENLNLNRLHDWVEYTNSNQVADFYEIKVGDNNIVGIDSVRLKELLNYESDAQLARTLTTAPAIMKNGAKMLDNFSKHKIFLKLKNIDYLSHEALSSVECKRRDFLSLKPNVPLPTVKQGTIVKKGNQYFICMQPLCDSVRISCSTNFIFLGITIAEQGKKFTHVLKDSQGDFVKFNIKPGSKNIHIFKLMPNTETNTAKTVFEDGEYKVKYLKDNNQEDCLTWFGELKTNVAQAIANHLAEQISRVGLDTNEWLRRH